MTKKVGLNIEKPINVIHISKTKKEKSMITLINTHTQISDKIQRVLIIKALGILGREGNFFNPIKDIYKNCTANIILNDERLNTLRSGTKAGCSTFFTSLQHRTVLMRHEKHPN